MKDPVFPTLSLTPKMEEDLKALCDLASRGAGLNAYNLVTIVLTAIHLAKNPEKPANV